MSNQHVGTHPMIPRFVRLFSLPILLGWLVLTVIVNVVVPQIEEVGQAHAVSLSPADAPSMQAMKRIGSVFHEFDSNTTAMLVLEGDQPLGQSAHDYYDGLIKKLQADTKHIQHIQDFWSDPLTAAGSQSADGKAAYVQMYLAGNQGETLSNESVQAVRDIVEKNPPPQGLHAYVTGPGPLMADQQHAGDKSLELITIVTIGVILVMLMLVYHSVPTVLIVVAMMLLELMVARGVVAFLGFHDLIGLSTFAVNLLTMLAIAAGTDYAIFLVGRYHEARHNGEDRETAFYTTYHGTAHVILGSGLTIAGATYCLSFTRLPFFQTLGVPLAVGMVVVVAAALTLAPAIIVVASRFGLMDPKRKMETKGWRRMGAAVVRWPGPILVAATALALVGLLALPSYKTNYNDRDYLPGDVPAQVGYAAADRHFPQARLNPELLLVETDHDLRNPADMLVIDKIAKDVFHIPGIGRVQSISRPLGTPIEHSTIPFMISSQGNTQTMNQTYQDDRTKDLLTQANMMQSSVDSLTKTLALTERLSVLTQKMAGTTKQTVEVTNELRDHIADFEDTFRPLRNYFYWEPHCFDIPLCWSLRSIFDTIDGIDTLADQLKDLSADVTELASITPQMVAAMRPMLTTMKAMKVIALTNYATQRGLQEQQKANEKNSTALGAAFDKAKNDDSFYMPPEAFDNPDFKRGLKQFVSPDGKSVRFIISHEGDPATEEGISHIAMIKNVAFEAIKGTPLEGSKIYLGGTAATYKDMQQGSAYDLMIAGLSSLCLIFIIMLLLTRAVIASLVIVGTVLVSLGASFGLSVLVWQHIVGLELHWMVLPMSVIILLAVGSDYNLLLVSRIKEEIHAGLKTGIIRSVAGSGSVVTSAGMVFAFTMMSMVISELRVVGQIGTTIGMGLLFDTLVVRAFMTPSIAALLGRWFWWPVRVHTHAAAPEPTAELTPAGRHGAETPPDETTTEFNHGGSEDGPRR